MKKILVLFLMLFGFGQVSALEYSDYSDFSEYTDAYIESDELTDVKVERRYKYYKLEKELGGYGEDTTLDYPFIDKEDYIYSNYSSLSIEKPEEKEDRIIETVDGYHYSKVKDINYLKIRADIPNMILSDFKLLYNGEKIEYDVELEKVSENYEFEQDGYIKFNFKEDLELRYLTLSYTGTNTSSSFSCTIYISFGKDDSVYYSAGTSFLKGSKMSWKGINITCPDNMYEDFYSEEELLVGNSFKLVGPVTLYKYKDILYRNYKLNRVYYDEYLTMPYEDYIYMDETLYKDFYAKRTRQIISETITPIQDVVINEDKSLDNSNPKKISNVLDKTDSVYKVPSKSIYYPLNINKIDDLKEVNSLGLLYILFPFLLLLVILILVLSKLYQKKKDCVTV